MAEAPLTGFERSDLSVIPSWLNEGAGIVDNASLSFDGANEGWPSVLPVKAPGLAVVSFVRRRKNYFHYSLLLASGDYCLSKLECLEAVPLVRRSLSREPSQFLIVPPSSLIDSVY